LNDDASGASEEWTNNLLFAFGGARLAEEYCVEFVFTEELTTQTVGRSGRGRGIGRGKAADEGREELSIFHWRIHVK